MFVVKLSKSCIVTYLGIIFGLLALYVAISKEVLLGMPYISVSLICLMLSGICDMFDGKFARHCKRTDVEKMMGIEMDSLADTFCFLVVPVAIMLSLGMRHPIYLIIFGYFFISGITRLAYFNVTSEVGKVVKCYNGLPVTSSAIVYPLLGLINIFVHFNNIEIILGIATLLIGFLFNFKIKVPKFNTKTSIIISALAVLLLIAFMVF